MTVVNYQMLYNALLAQLAAEAYLTSESDTPAWEDAGTLANRLRLGSNHFERFLPDVPVLPGATRMTESQIRDFNDRYEVVHQLANTWSGFSGRLLKDKTRSAR
jgi:hypothetical protein